MAAITQKIPDSVQFFLGEGNLKVEKGASGCTTYSLLEDGNQAFKELLVKVDRYEGLHLDVTDLSRVGAFHLKAKINAFIDRSFDLYPTNAFWLEVKDPHPPSFYSLIPQEIRMNSIFEGKKECRLEQDSQEKKTKILIWLNPDRECPIPLGATHNMGAKAVVIDLAKKAVLLVQRLILEGLWNFPGGSFDGRDQDTLATAKRETLEETGVCLENCRHLLVGEESFPKNPLAPAISRVFAFYGEGLSNQTLTPQLSEVSTARWILVEDILKAEEGEQIGSAKVTKQLIDFLRNAVERKGWEELTHSEGGYSYRTTSFERPQLKEERKDL